ncbi:MAG: DNA repair protein RecO [Chloroflexi bacterium]|nr:DNA repair protein RecO [Chloroflexota bacterium]
MDDAPVTPSEQGAKDRARLYRTPAIVLRRSDFGEADRLVTVLTPAMGKLRLLAKGVRRPTSHKAGHLELFTLAQLLVARGRTLDLVSQAEAMELYRPLREDLLRAAHAYYVAELVDRLAQEELESAALFAAFRDALGWLAESANLPLTTRYVELQLLQAGGVQPQLHCCVRCGQPLEPADHWFSWEEGGVCCQACGADERGLTPLSLGALKVLRFLQTRPYGLVMQLRLSPAVMREVEELLQRHLEYHLERRLESAALLRQLRGPTLAPEA